MTWSLAHESATITTPGSVATSDSSLVAFWDYFFSTFLPTKGWTTDVSTYSSSGTYYLCKKEFIQANGLNMRWCFNWRMLWSSDGYATLYVMPWVTSTADITNSIHSQAITSSFPGMDKEDLEGKHLQIWESDAHPDAFFLKTRETSVQDGCACAIHFPDLWHFCDPNFGTNIDPDADVSTSPIWFNDNGEWKFQDYDDWDKANIDCKTPEYFTYKMKNNGYLTNRISAGLTASTNYNVLRGTADDILFRKMTSGYIFTNNWQAVGYQGKNYIDVGYKISRGYMLDVGQVDPQTGV